MRTAPLTKSNDAYINIVVVGDLLWGVAGCQLVFKTTSSFGTIFILVRGGLGSEIVSSLNFI